MRNKLFLTLAVTCMLVAAAIVMTTILRPETAVAADENPKYIEVEGEATLDVKPDTVTLNLGCRTQLPTAKEAQEENARKMNAVIQKLLDMGIARNDITTTNLALYPVYDYSQKSPRITGYTAENMVKVITTQLEKVGTILDAAVGAGANSVSNISFSIKDAEPYRQQLLAKAAEVARARAEVLAKTSGASIKGVRCIVQSQINQPPVYPLRSADMKVMQAADTPVLEGQLTLRAVLRVQYDI